MKRNIFFMATGKRINEKQLASKLTEESISSIHHLGNAVSEHLARYSNTMWVGPSFTCRYTGFYLKRSILHNGKSIDYNDEMLLKDTKCVAWFIETKLKKVLYKNNVIIAERNVCEAIIKLCVPDASFDENSICYITYLPNEDKFIYQGCIK